MVSSSTIRYFIKYHGIGKTIRAVLYYLYSKLREVQIDLTGEHIIEVNGYKLKLIPNDKGISSELLMFKTHEPLTTHILSQNVSQGMICLDIGSNIGYYAVLESKNVGEKGKVIAIEPSPVNFDYLTMNSELQDTANIKVHNFAVGDRNGTIDFVISRESNWSRVVEDNKIVKPGDKMIKIQIKTVDTFLEENPIERLDFLRMDVEGHELKIFKGSKNTLRKFKPILMIEFHKMYLGKNETRELLQELKSMGYESKYYIPRLLDMPVIGNIGDVKKFGLEELLAKLEDGSLPNVFQVLLQ